jgi:hypothetical protein
MINWYRKDKFKLYKDQLKKAFPRALEIDLDVVFEVIPFDVNDVALCNGKTQKVNNLINDSFLDVTLNGEKLTIPYRIYFNEPNPTEEKELTVTQKAILNCLYLRHHNGYLRQRRLEQLVENNQYWITPFSFQLLGEYVYEIVEVLEKQLDDYKLENYKHFVIENPTYWQKTESRMISYWNEYYRRRFPKIKDYIGKNIVDQIKIKTIGKRQDEIMEVGIDDKERLYIKPKKERFTLIYTTATEVHWDNKEFFLYSPKPKEWGYFNWFKNMTRVAEIECNCKLFLTDRTIWTNIPNELKKQICAKTKHDASSHLNKTHESSH